MNSVFRYLNALNLDVSLGAVASAAFFGKQFRAPIRPAAFVALGLTVWIIYSVDRLLDAKKIKHPAATFRHQFYQRHFNAVLVVTACATIADVVALFYIRRPVFVGGIVLFTAVAAYLLVNYFWSIPKEPIIALLYTVGVLLPSISLTSLPVGNWPLIPIAHFFLTALLNLLVFAWFDTRNDMKDGLSSFVVRFGEAVTRAFIWCLVFASYLLVIFIRAPLVSLPLLLMTTVLFVIFYYRHFFGSHERYRVLGDAIFFLPLIIFL